MTCPLCHKLLRDATTISECLHTFCRKCILKKLNEEEVDYCPICNIDLGCIPVEKLRPDHNLQDIRAKIFPLKRRKVNAPEVTPSFSFPVIRKERSLSSLVVNTPRIATQNSLTGRRSKAVGRRAAALRGLSPAVNELNKKENDNDECPENSSSSETLSKMTQNRRQNISKAESSCQTTHQGLENGRDPFLDKAELWKPLNCLVEAANRTKALKSTSSQCSVVKAEQINFPDSEVHFTKMKVRDHISKSHVLDEMKASVSTTQSITKARRLNGAGRRRKELETSAQALVDAAGKRERRRSPVWFSLVAVTDKEGDDPLPQISASYLRIRLNMKSPRTKTGMASTSKAIKRSFLPSGALGRGRGLGLRDLCSLGVSKQKTPIGDRSEPNAFAPRGTPLLNYNSFVLEEELMQEDISLHPTDQARQGSQRMEVDQVMEDNHRVEDEQVVQNNQRVEVEQMMQDNQKSAEAGSSATKKVKKVRGQNKCKEVAALEPGEKLKVTFFNNRAVGKNHRLFSRHLGKLVRDSNMCPLAVESWRDIEQERLQHLWDAVVDKFESDDMDIHREHVFEWMKELWNRWRGNLHAKYVRDKPIQEALRKVPKGVDKKQWEWLIKKHFSTESFQETSKRNSANRAKLKMPHHIGSKPIREIIYQKGGKDGNPPDLATIFFETRKKKNNLVEPETIEKHAQIQELVQSQPSLDSIEMVERCFGPQNRSHVVVFGGGVKAKDFKGVGSSKTELMSKLRSTQEENNSLKERLATIERKVNEIKKTQRNVFISTISSPTSIFTKFKRITKNLKHIPGFDFVMDFNNVIFKT